MTIKIIKKKAWNPYFEDIKTGKKNFDVRLNDFDVKVGDAIQFQLYDPAKKEYVDGDRNRCTRVVRYILPITLDSYSDVAVGFGEDRDQFWSRQDIRRYGLIILGF